MLPACQSPCAQPPRSGLTCYHVTMSARLGRRMRARAIQQHGVGRRQRSDRHGLLQAARHIIAHDSSVAVGDLASQPLPLRGLSRFPAAPRRPVPSVSCNPQYVPTTGLDLVWQQHGHDTPAPARLLSKSVYDSLCNAGGVCVSWLAAQHTPSNNQKYPASRLFCVILSSLLTSPPNY